MRASGLPLAHADSGEEESDNSKITAIIAINSEQVDAYVATPSGLLYRFTPSEFEAEWWSFALRSYHVVTGNMADRQWLIERASVDAVQVKGKCLSRAKGGGLSGLSLEQLFEQMCPSQQSSLFAE